LTILTNFDSIFIGEDIMLEPVEGNVVRYWLCTGYRNTVPVVEYKFSSKQLAMESVAITYCKRMDELEIEEEDHAVRYYRNDNRRQLEILIKFTMVRFEILDEPVHL